MMNEDTEHIVGVAVRTPDGRLFTAMRPARHDTPIIAAIAAGYEGEDLADQGFISNNGTFYNRREAAPIARAAGQIIWNKDTDFLCSENLW